MTKQDDRISPATLEDTSNAAEPSARKPRRAIYVVAAVMVAICLVFGCAAAMNFSPLSNASQQASEQTAAQEASADAENSADEQETNDESNDATTSSSSNDSETTEASEDKTDTKADSQNKNSSSKEEKASKTTTSSKTSSSKSAASSKKTDQSNKKTATGTNSSATSEGKSDSKEDSKAAAQMIQVHIKVDASAADDDLDYKNTFVNTTVTLEEGASVYDALKATGVSIKGDSSYVKAINGLAEKMDGSKSGWMYSVNGTVPMKSCGKYKLSDGDKVRWYYVTSD